MEGGWSTPLLWEGSGTHFRGGQMGPRASLQLAYRLFEVILQSVYVCVCVVFLSNCVEPRNLNN